MRFVYIYSHKQTNIVQWIDTSTMKIEGMQFLLFASDGAIWKDHGWGKIISIVYQYYMNIWGIKTRALFFYGTFCNFIYICFYKNIVVLPHSLLRPARGFKKKDIYKKHPFHFIHKSVVFPYLYCKQGFIKIKILIFKTNRRTRNEKLNAEMQKIIQK